MSSPKRRKVPRAVLQRHLNAAIAFRELVDLPDQRLLSRFESESAARQALIDATMFEAHHAFAQPLGVGSRDPTMHAIDLTTSRPGIVADARAKGGLHVLVATEPLDTPAPAPRRVRRKGCIRTVLSAARLESRRADQDQARRDAPPKPRRPRTPRAPVVSNGAEEPQVSRANPGDKSEMAPHAPTESAPDEARTTGRDRPRAPREEMMVVTTAAFAEHALFESPGRWVQQLRLLEGGALHAAVSHALIQGHASDAVQLVVGPPGTGKSVELLRRTAEAATGGGRILVTAPTNLAVADLFARSAHHPELAAAALVMRSSRVPIGVVPTGLLGRRIDPESAAPARIVFATVATAMLACMARTEGYEHVLVDEAGLLPEASCWCVLGPVTRRLTLCGDPAQLEAVVSMEGRALGFGRSLFRRLLELPYPAHELRVQRRMHPAIAALSIDRFYQGQVTTEYVPPPDMPVGLLGVSRRWAAEVGEEACGTSFLHRAEAALAARIARELCRALPLGHSVVVLAPYAAQVEACTALLVDEPDVQVSTVDAFQGREASAVVLSVVRDARRGFWADDARLCVALTRARHHMTILAGPGWGQLFPENKTMAGPGWGQLFPENKTI